MLEGLTKYFNVNFNLNVKECVYINCGFFSGSFSLYNVRVKGQMMPILILRYARWDLVFMRCGIRKHLKNK